MEAGERNLHGLILFVHRIFDLEDGAGILRALGNEPESIGGIGLVQVLADAGAEEGVGEVVAGVGRGVIVDQIALLVGLVDGVRHLDGRGFIAFPDGGFDFRDIQVAPSHRAGAREGEGAGVLQADEGDLVDLDVGQFGSRVLDGELDARERVVQLDRSALRVIFAQILLMVHLDAAEDDVLLRGRGGGRGVARCHHACVVAQVAHAVGRHVRRHIKVELDVGRLVLPDIHVIAMLVGPAVGARFVIQAGVGGVDTAGSVRMDTQLVLVKVTDILRIDRRTPGFRGVGIKVHNRFFQEEVEVVHGAERDGHALLLGTDTFGPGLGALKGKGDLISVSGSSPERLFLLAGNQGDGGKRRQVCLLSHR